MIHYLTTDWKLFCGLFIALLLITFFMMRQSQYFFTKDPVVRRFSIMELELPGKPNNLVKVINGIRQLTTADERKVLIALKGQLWLDFLFMPAAYGCIALLCLHLAPKLVTSAGKDFFYTLAALQVVPFVCDIIENGYLLQKIKQEPVVASSQAIHTSYLIMELFKWGIALLSFVCAISAAFYYWVTGKYAIASLKYLVFCVIGLIVFAICNSLFSKKIEMNDEV